MFSRYVAKNVFKEIIELNWIEVAHPPSSKSTVLSGKTQLFVGQKNKQVFRREFKILGQT